MLHRRVLRAAAAAFVLLAAACGDGTGPAPRPTSLSLESRDVAVADGGADTLTAAVLDQRGRPIQGAAVRWSVGDTGVAKVDSAGVLTGNRPGTTFAFATFALQDGGSLRDSARVTVRTTPARIESLGRGFVTAPGETYPFRFRVLDRRGQPLPGVEVKFAVARGSATLTRASAVTDTAGVVSVAARVGTESIDADISASVEGVATPAYYLLRFPRATGGLEPDSLVLTPNCTRTLLLRVRDPATGETLTGQSAAYSVEDSTVVTLRDVIASGTFRGVLRDATGARVGTTRVVARWLSGLLVDTAVVRVEAPVPTRLRFSFNPGSVAVGAQTANVATVTDQCVVPQQDAQVVYRSLDPDVVSVTAPTQPGALVGLNGLKPGEGRVVAEAGALADTLRISVTAAP
jgi:hypothetical protein